MYFLFYAHNKQIFNTKLNFTLQIQISCDHKDVHIIVLLFPNLAEK